MLAMLWSMLFGWLPVLVQICFGAFCALLVIFLILRIIAFILDAIPFL